MRRLEAVMWERGGESFAGFADRTACTFRTPARVLLLFNTQMGGIRFDQYWRGFSHDRRAHLRSLKHPRRMRHFTLQIDANVVTSEFANEISNSWREMPGATSVCVLKTASTVGTRGVRRTHAHLRPTNDCGPLARARFRGASPCARSPRACRRRACPWRGQPQP